MGFYQPKVGDRVKRGSGWEYDDQGGGTNGTVTKKHWMSNWWNVSWDNGECNTYQPKDLAPIDGIAFCAPVPTNVHLVNIAVVFEPTDAEIVSAYEAWQQAEYKWRMPDDAIHFQVFGVNITLAAARAAWSRELRRRLGEAEEKRRLPCQGDYPEEHEGR